MKVVVFSLIIIGLLNSCKDCRTYANEFKMKQYNFVVQKKSIENVKESKFVGINSKGEEVIFQEVGFAEVYNSVQIGDTIIKELGSADVKVCQKDTCIVCHWYCDGIPIE